MGASILNIPPATYQFVEKKTIAAGELTFTVAGNYKYLIFCEFAHDAGNTVHLEINGDSTAANYRRQTLDVAGAVTSPGRVSDSVFGYTNIGNNSYNLTIWRDTTSGYACYQSFNNNNIPADVSMSLYFGAKVNATVASITSIKLKADGATLTGTAQLYRIQGY